MIRALYRRALLRNLLGNVWKRLLHHHLPLMFADAVVQNRNFPKRGQQCSDCSLPPLADQFPLNPSNQKLLRQGRNESRVEEDPFVKYQVAEPEIVGIAPSGITVALAGLAG